MSKKTNAEKMKARAKTKAGRISRKRTRGRRPNPAIAMPLKTKRGNTPLVLSDPIAMHHLCGFLLRTIELTLPRQGEAYSGKVDAEFMSDLLAPDLPTTSASKPEEPTQ